MPKRNRRNTRCTHPQELVGSKNTNKLLLLQNKPSKILIG